MAKNCLLFSNRFSIIIKLSARSATVAQSVEQLIRNQQVAGSSPASSSKNRHLCKKKAHKCRFFFYRFCRRIFGFCNKVRAFGRSFR